MNITTIVIKKLGLYHFHVKDYEGPIVVDIHADKIYNVIDTDKHEIDLSEFFEFIPINHLIELKKSLPSRFQQLYAKTIQEAVKYVDNDEGDNVNLLRFTSADLSIAKKVNNRWYISGYDGTFKFVNNLGYWAHDRVYDVPGPEYVVSKYFGSASRAGLFVTIDGQNASIADDEVTKQSGSCSSFRLYKSESVPVEAYSIKESPLPTPEQEAEVDRLINDPTKLLGRFCGNL